MSYVENEDTDIEDIELEDLEENSEDDSESSESDLEEDDDDLNEVEEDSESDLDDEDDSELERLLASDVEDLEEDLNEFEDVEEDLNDVEEDLNEFEDVEEDLNEFEEDLEEVEEFEEDLNEVDRIQLAKKQHEAMLEARREKYEADYMNRVKRNLIRNEINFSALNASDSEDSDETKTDFVEVPTVATISKKQKQRDAEMKRANILNQRVIKNNLKHMDSVDKAVESSPSIRGYNYGISLEDDESNYMYMFRKQANSRRNLTDSQTKKLRNIKYYQMKYE